MTRRQCGHGRPIGMRQSCPGCAARIPPDAYWDLLRVLRERARRRARGLPVVPRREAAT